MVTTVVGKVSASCKMTINLSMVEDRVSAKEGTEISPDGTDIRYLNFLYLSYL